MPTTWHQNHGTCCPQIPVYQMQKITVGSFFMRGVYCVAIVLLVAADRQTAVKSDQDEVQQVPDDDFIVSAGSINEMLHSRVLRESRNPENDLVIAAGNEERGPLTPSKLLADMKAPDSFISAAHVMRTEGEASAIEAASNTLNQLRSNKRQRIASAHNDVVGQVVRSRPDPNKSPVSVANDVLALFAKKRKRRRPTTIKKNAARSVTQDHYRLVPSDPLTSNGEALNGRLYKQLISQKALQLDKNDHLDGEDIVREDLVSFDLLYLFEKSALPTAVNRQEASAIRSTSKNLIKLESNKRKRIASTPNNVDGQVLHAPPDPGKFSVLVANNKPLVSAKIWKGKHSPAIMENASRFAKQDDNRLAPSHPSTFNAETSSGHLNKQLITQKALQLDKHVREDNVENLREKTFVSVDHLLHLFENIDKSAHPTVVNRQEVSAIEVATKSLDQSESNTRIASKPKNVVGQVVDSPPDADKSPVLVAMDTSTVLANRLKKALPTVIMQNAARVLKEHDFRRVPSDSLTMNAEAPDGRLGNQLIAQKALQLNENEHVDDVEIMPTENLVLVEDLVHLPDRIDKPAQFTATNYQSVSIDWVAENMKGPFTLPKDKVNEEVKKVHAAFLEAFHLPFHQYPKETAVMLRLVRRNTRSNPNNVEICESFETLAEIQGQSRLLTILSLDSKELLKDGKTVLPNNMENLEEAYTVKLIIMYELFYLFCHDRNRISIIGLPSKIESKQWILKLSI